jgi:streptomycin 6-kinase
VSFPEPFATNIKTVFEDGEAWLSNLPALITEISSDWNLAVEAPTWPLSFNYVAPATLTDGTPVVLKLGVPNSERTSEIETLKLWDGNGCARLLKSDTERGAMLIERISPGTMLSELQDDDQATRLAAEVFQRVRFSPNPAPRGYPGEPDKENSLFGSPFPGKLVEAAEGLFAELLPSQGPQVLLHGDLHHFNILFAGEERGWLAIDPQGVLGEAEYECGALLRNHDLDKRSRAEIKKITGRRVEILAEMLGFDRQRIIGWGLAQAVLSAWWDWHPGAPSGWTSPMFVLADVLNELR